MSNQEPWQGQDRRKKPRSRDKFYRLVLGINVFAWVVFLAALVVFHYARPELVSGLQEYWGLDVRRDWSETLSFYLIILLCICISLGVVTYVFRKQRTRRKGDFFGINLGFLITITVVGLASVLYQLFWSQ